MSKLLVIAAFLAVEIAPSVKMKTVYRQESGYERRDFKRFIDFDTNNVCYVSYYWHRGSDNISTAVFCVPYRVPKAEKEK